MPSSFFIFGLEIKFYGVCIALGFLTALLLAIYYCKKKNLPKDMPYELLLIVFPLAIIGARLFYVAFSGYSWTFAQILRVWDGGLAIYGGIIAGFLGVLVYCKVKKLKLLAVLDIIVPGLIIAQSIGRWGNFFNQEAYGYSTGTDFLKFFPMSVYIQADSTWHLATFFYESMWNFIGFWILHSTLLRTNKNGLCTGIYLAYYGIGRVWIEGLRTDSLYIGGTSIRVSQLISAILVVVGILLIMYSLGVFKKIKKGHKNEKIKT